MQGEICNYIWGVNKKIKFLLFLSLWTSLSMAQGVRFGLNPIVSSTQEGSPYVDVYSTLDASTLAYEMLPDSTWVGSLKVVLILDNKVDVFAFEYNHVDSASGAPLLLQKSTFLLENWSPIPIQVDLTDGISGQNWSYSDTILLKTDPVRVTAPLVLDTVKTTMALYQKSGSSVVPKANLGLPLITQPSVEWYAEAFAQHGKHVLQYHMVDLQGSVIPGTYGFKRMVDGLTPVRISYDLNDITSGTYGIVVKVLDEQAAVIAEAQTNFQWFDEDALSKWDVAGEALSRNAFEQQGWGNWELVPEYLKMIAPVVSLSDRRILMNLKEQPDTALAAKFLVNYWKNRAPQEPKGTWQGYLQIVEKVDKEFGSKTLKGYMTQMGRVFLQYGAPSLVEERPFDGKNYPYQIWQYDQLKSPSTPTQQNQVFIFVDQELIGRQYTLIHSSAIGEIKDHKWQYHLSRHTNAGPDIDATSTKYGRDNFGERISNSLIIGNQGTWFDMYNN
jgi:GWxTD domain-containing protein